MPQIRGPRARWALVGAMALSIATTSGALGESVMSIELRASRLARPAPTLAANLDRSTVAPYRELARVNAVAALATRNLQAAAASTAKAPQAPIVVRNHLWIPSLAISRSVYVY